MSTRKSRRSLGLTLFHISLALWLSCLLLVSVAGLAVLAYNVRYSGLRSTESGGLLFEGISVLGVPVGGLGQKEALERLRTTLHTQAYPYVTLHTAQEEWTLSTEDLGGLWELEQAIAEAWAMGRSGIFRYDLLERLQLLWWGYDIVPAFRLEPGPSIVPLRQIARQVGHPTRRASLQVAGLRAESGTPQVGRELDLTATRRAVQGAVQGSLGRSGWGHEPRLLRLLERRSPVWMRASLSVAADEPVRVALVFREIVPPLTEVAGARERAATVLSAPIVLTCELPVLRADGSVASAPRRWAIDQAVLSSWLTVNRTPDEEGATLQVDVDRQRIRSFLMPLVDEIAQTPREGRYSYDAATGALTTVWAGQYGYAFDLEAAVAQVAQACLGEERTVALPVAPLAPRVTRADLEALLPLDLISEGETSFQGSTPDRLQNIQVSTARFDGVVVPRESTFSFLDHLGLVTVANGYSLSWVIYGDRTLLGPGGGVCQVSTTCFRAAFWGGYPIVERRPHTYRVSWYEPPLGLDAAVFSPLADMRFQNDADTPILIRTEVDETNAKLFFRFYGRSSGRKVSLEGPESENPVAAGEPVYEDDFTLAPGQTVQVERARDGLDVRIYRVIEVPGQETVREELFSRYGPWPARFKRGPSENQQAVAAP
ncbi:MAG: VanW family protein [Anaerolineae bacterium]|nr:VanW family protein [Anaerolineae bacterium]